MLFIVKFTGRLEKDLQKKTSKSESKSKSKSTTLKSKSKSKSGKSGLESGLESKSGLEYYKSGLYKQICHQNQQQISTTQGDRAHSTDVYQKSHLSDLIFS